MSDYGYLNARIRGFSSRLLTAEFFEQVLAVEGQEPLIDALLNSDYRPQLRESLAEGRGPAAVEAGLRRNLIQTFQRIRALMPPKPDRLLSIQFCRWDLQNIIAILRGKATGAPSERITAALFPAGQLAESQLRELAGEPDVIAVGHALAILDVPFAMQISQIVLHHSDPVDLIAIEQKCIREYFAWALDQLSHRNADDRLILAHLEYEIDLANVMTSLQIIHRQQRGWAGDAIETIPGGRLRSSLLAAIKRCGDLDEAFTLLASTYFSSGVQKGILSFATRQRLGLMERLLEEVVIEHGCRMFRTNPLGIGVAAGYVWRKLNEFMNLRILLRGKAYGRPAPAIRQELLIA